MKKRFGVFVLIFSFLLCFAFAAACSDPVNDKTELSQIEITSNPTKTQYFAGDAFEKAGLVVTAVYSDKTKKVVTDSVIVPTALLAAGQTAVVVSYSEDSITKTAEVPVAVKALTESEQITIPDSNLTVTASTDSESATANFYVEYGETSLNITALTVDSSIKSESSVYTGDSVEMFVSTIQRIDGVTDGTLHVIVAPDGTHLIEVYDNATTGYAALTDGSVVITASPFTLLGKEDEGYKVTVKVPYELLSISAEEKKASICVGLTNSAGGGAVNTTFNSTFGTNSEYSHTYVAIKDDNTFEENEWLQLGKNFGDAGALKAKNSWDIEADDGASKTIKMTDVSGDNNIYMYREDAPVLYAKAKFTANELRNNEKSSKFGLTLFTQSGDGIMFYIGASSADGIEMTGTTLGYATSSSFTWTGFTDIGSIGKATDYQGDNGVELAIYRQNKVIVLYCNGVEVRTLSGMPGIENANTANFGIVSFNTMLTVKDYSVTSNETELSSMKIIQKDKDYLFIGDSYVDRGFWGTFNAEFNGIDAENMGIGGTKTDYWVDMLDAVKTLYNPSKITVHIGINDINGGTTAEVLIPKIKNLFNKYQETFPNVEIYYISLNPNAFIPENWATCQTVNTAIKEYTEANEKLHFIDFATTLGNTAGNDVAKYFIWDGLHLNADGYALWTRDIKTALGIDYTPIDALGFGDAGDFTSSAGWKAHTDGYIENTGNGESPLYIKGLNASEFYAEASITVMGKNNADAFPKIGMSIKGKLNQSYFFIDVADGNGGVNNKWGSLVTRPIKSDWLWGQGKPFSNYNAAYSAGTYFKFAVAKIGNMVYFLANDIPYYVADNLFIEDEILSVSILNHNLTVRAKDASYITESVTLQAKFDSLGIAKASGNKVVDGDLKDWTAADKQGRWVVPATGGRSATAYAKMEDDGVYIAYDVYHNNNPKDNADWSKTTNIEFTIGDKAHRHFNILGDSVNIGFAQFKQAEEGELWHSVFEVFVPYFMIPGYDKTSASIPIDFAFKSMETGAMYFNDNPWWFMYGGHPYENNSNRVTKAGYNAPSGLILDGDISGWDDSLTAYEATVDSDQISIKSFTADDGLYFILTATTTGTFSTNVGNNADWSLNSNLEVSVGGKTPTTKFIIFNNKLTVGDGGGAGAFKLVDKTLTIEGFIPSWSIPNWNSETKSTTLGINLKLKGVWGLGISGATITPSGITE